VDREDLTVGQVDTETKADQREDVAGEESVLALPAQGAQDLDIGDQAEERDGQAGERRVNRGLDGFSSVGDPAHRMQTGVVHVRQVTGDADPAPRERDTRAPESAVGHRPPCSTASNSAANGAGVSDAG
jgi:hypothetical protein